MFMCCDEDTIRTVFRESLLLLLLLLFAKNKESNETASSVDHFLDNKNA